MIKLRKPPDRPCSRCGRSAPAVTFRQRSDRAARKSACTDCLIADNRERSREAQRRRRARLRQARDRAS